MTKQEELDRLHVEYGIQPLSQEEARRFAQVDADERKNIRYNYHKNIYDSMFWGGATQEQLDRYAEQYL